MAKTIWIYGVYGAGKTSLARDIKLFTLLKDAVLLDADEVRLGLNAGLGHSDEGIAENIRRLAEVAALLNRQGLNVVVAACTPKRANRVAARAIADPIFVWVDTDLDLTVARDHRGLYSRSVLDRDHFRREFEEPTEEWEDTEWRDLWAMLRVDPNRVIGFGRYADKKIRRTENENENEDGKKADDGDGEEVQDVRG